MRYDLLYLVVGEREEFLFTDTGDFPRGIVQMPLGLDRLIARKKGDEV
jgi:hypothetical protein